MNDLSCGYCGAQWSEENMLADPRIERLWRVASAFMVLTHFSDRLASDLERLVEARLKAALAEWPEFEKEEESKDVSTK